MPTYKVFYAINSTFEESGSEFGAPEPYTIDRLFETHAVIGKFEARNPGDLFYQLNNWVGPEHMRDVFKQCRHTSMSVGDVLKDCSSGKYFEVMRYGFRELSNLRYQFMDNGSIVLEDRSDGESFTLTADELETLRRLIERKPQQLELPI